MIQGVVVSVFVAPLVALAVWQSVETWRHGSIFFERRQQVRRWQKSSWRVVRFVGDLLMCPFCLPHWVAGFYSAILLSQLDLPLTLATIAWWWVLSLAVTRMSQVGNDVMKGLELTQSPAGDVIVDGDDDVTFSEPG